MKPGEAQVYVAFMHGGFDDQRYANLLQALEHPKMGLVVEAFYTAIADNEQHTTMAREEVDPKGLAYQPGPRELWEKADIGPVMLSGDPLDANALSAIAIYRKFGAEPFSSREKQIAASLEISENTVAGYCKEVYRCSSATRMPCAASPIGRRPFPRRKCSSSRNFPSRSMPSAPSAPEPPVI